LRQPDGLILNTHLDTVFPGLPGKNQKFGGTVSDAGGGLFGHGVLLSILLLIPFNGHGFDQPDFRAGQSHVEIVFFRLETAIL